MNQVYEKLMRCYASVREKVDFKPRVALVLGSGLGNYGEQIKISQVLDYHEIEGFPVSTVPGHKGRFLFGYVDDVPVVAMQGRVHYYEGYPMTDVVLPIRLMKLLGAGILFLTNAAGGVNPEFSAGDFMLIKDQIASFVPSPLIGENLEELGPRFCDMSEVYDKDLPAEVKMCRTLGADAVGMSTACEGIAANHMGMKICGISCISNLACGLTDQPLSHQEVQETADRVAPLFEKLVTASIVNMAKGE